MAFSQPFKPRSLVKIKGQPFVWEVVGSKINMRDHQWHIKLSRNGGWATITTTLPADQLVEFTLA